MVGHPLRLGRVHQRVTHLHQGTVIRHGQQRAINESCTSTSCCHQHDVTHFVSWQLPVCMPRSLASRRLAPFKEQAKHLATSNNTIRIKCLIAGMRCSEMLYDYCQKPCEEQNSIPDSFCRVCLTLLQAYGAAWFYLQRRRLRTIDTSLSKPSSAASAFKQTIFRQKRSMQ